MSGCCPVEKRAGGVLFMMGGVSAVTHLLSHLNMTCLNVVRFSYLFCSVQRTGPVVKTGLLNNADNNSMKY